jgi:preprotein translocase subunit SecF
MKFFHIVPTNTNVDFIGKFPVFVTLSMLTVVASIVAMFAKGFHFGVDFTGGTVMQVRFAQPTQPEEVRKLLASVNVKDASVAALGKGDTEYLITVLTATVDKEKNGLSQQLLAQAGPDKLKIEQMDIVGPKVGGELKMSAIRALFYSIIIITIYIWFRFDFKFAPGATFAMMHDIILATGYYVFLGKEFNITAVAALLTIAGYSVNDTIIIYDRVRELVKVGGDQMPLGQTINRAINLTLSRTLLTSGLTLLSIVPIAVFCTGEIKDFAEAMIFGIFVGTYSTIYVAAPLTIYVQKFMAGKEQRKKTPVGKPVTA